MSLSQFRGKVVLIGFVYTQCPDADFCIKMSLNFKILQDELGSRMGSEVIFLLISFDPSYDTPDVLKTYGKAYGADFSAWQFLMGDNETIQQVKNDYNVNAFPLTNHENETNQNQTLLNQNNLLSLNHESHSFLHDWVTVLIDKNGMIRRDYNKSEWSIKVAKTDILSLLE